jgi:AmmeMemoRadiSam system protein B
MSDQFHPCIRKLPGSREEGGWRFEDPLGLASAGLWSDEDYRALREPGAKLSGSLLYRLSQHCLLDDAHWRERWQVELALYRSTPSRPFAGPDRARDPFSLRVAIAGMIADDWDMPPARAPRGLLVPAAPLAASARLLGRAFAAVRHERFERIVLLGDSRAELGEPLCVESRPHDTPLGTQPSDAEACARIQHSDEGWQLVHRGSTTLEPVLLFVRIVFPQVPIVALLASRDHSQREAALVQLSAGLPDLSRTLIVCVADLSQQPAEPNSRALDTQHSESLQTLSLPEEAREVPAAVHLFVRWLWREDPHLRGNPLGYMPLSAPLQGRMLAMLFQRE